MIHSYHNFLFPFRFDEKIGNIKDRHEFYKEKRFEERVQITKAILEKSGWIYQQFEVKNHLDYNEMVYFYDFVKDALFNTSEFEKGATSYFFTKKNIVNEYTIKIKEDKSEYKLEIVGISLRIFDTGVAILSFELENHIYTDLNDILKINEFGRRIYPQFLSENFSLSDVKNTFLPEYMYVNGITENFIRSEFKKIELASFIVETLGGFFLERYMIHPLLDDRMFVMCWYGNDTFSKSLIDENYLKNDDWYRYVFVDKDKTVYSEKMQKSLIAQSTYDRWMNYKDGLTLFGVTRYSFMMLTNDTPFAKSVLLKHLQTIYFQMVVLLLTQRTSILRFSDEITAISDIDHNNKALTDKISNLYKHYLRFKNKLYFKEITPQEQGIELYDKARKIMRIDSDIQDLSSEIQSLNNYAFILEEKDEKEQMNKLTKLGTIFLPGTFIAGVFGMNVFGNSIEGTIWIIISILFIIGLSFYLIVIHEINIQEFFSSKSFKKNIKRFLKKGAS